MNAMLPFLSDDEILQIVSPLRQPAAIMRWFRSHGFPNAQKRPNGMPLISRASFDQWGGSQPSNTSTTPRVSLDIEGYLKKFAPHAKQGPRAEKV